MNSKIPTELFRAISFSAKKHRTQKRKDSDGTPYINHPMDVALNIAFLNSIDENLKLDIMVSAILHDTVEDTDTTVEEIACTFGSYISDLVEEVTNQKDLDSEQSKIFELEKAKTLSFGAALIRISDKIENIKDIDFNQPVKWDHSRKIKYCKWAKDLVNNINIDDEAIAQLKYMFFRTYDNTLYKLFNKT